jgi:hypothetical protein
MVWFTWPTDRKHEAGASGSSGAARTVARGTRSESSGAPVTAAPTVADTWT